MNMPALSLHQPWASLCVTRQPCDACDVCGRAAVWRFDGLNGTILRCSEHMEYTPHDQWTRPPMVKRFETRSWPFPPALIGQPIAFHATQRKPRGPVGDYTIHDWGNGGHQAVLGWNQPGNITAVRLPLGAIVGSGRITACYPIVGAGGCKNATAHVCRVNESLIRHTPLDAPEDGETEFIISDQLPYGDFTPGRYAWLIEDAAPTTERCPLALGVGHVYRPGDDCPVCDGAGRCDPIPWTSPGGRLPEWTP